MIEASGLSKSFRNGSVIALLDRNGAGESPTLRIVYTVMHR